MIKRKYGAVLILFLAIIGLLIYHPARRGTYSGASPGHAAVGKGSRNSTLGFQKIFVLNLPERTDRRDWMALISGYLNLDIEVIASVNGSITDKAMPYDVKNPPAVVIPPSALGCWRSHANLWSHIISSGISSALIFEDDVDFSVGIRDILEGVSTHLQELLGARNGESYGVVDGNSWDILGLGHCFRAFPDPQEHPKASRKIRGWVDPYTPALSDLAKKYLPDGGSEHVRVLGPSNGMLCTHGYAVTREGAMNLLYNIGGPGHILDAQWDWVLRDVLEKGGLKSYLIQPAVFGQWGFGDWRNTDVQPTSDEEESQWHGSWVEIVQSVRSEIEAVLGGYRNIWEEYERDKE